MEYYNEKLNNISKLSPEELDKTVCNLASRLEWEEGISPESAYYSALIMLSFPYSGKEEMTNEDIDFTVSSMLDYMHEKGTSH